MHAECITFVHAASVIPYDDGGARSWSTFLTPHVQVWSRAMLLIWRTRHTHKVQIDR